MNSCHKVVQSIKNTTLKLYADCAKQFDRKAQNCGKANHGFCAMITHQPLHRYLCVSFWPKNKTVNMPQPPYSSDQGSADFFLFPKLKTPMTGKYLAIFEEIKEKSKQGAIGYCLKAHFRSVSRIGKNAGISVLVCSRSVR